MIKNLHLIRFEISDPALWLFSPFFLLVNYITWDIMITQLPSSYYVFLYNNRKKKTDLEASSCNTYAIIFTFLHLFCATSKLRNYLIRRKKKKKKEVKSLMINYQTCY